MWSLRQKQDGAFYLTYDRSRRLTQDLRGLWEWIGPQGSVHTAHAVLINQQAGLLCCNDDERGVRCLVLED